MNKPIEYKRGFKGFLGCKIGLSQKPMIPRPETGFWLKRAIKTIKQGKKRVVCLDAFAGSGCVGIAVLKNCSDFCQRMDFIDIVKDFLKQIKINLDINKISPGKYKIIQSDIFENIKGGYDYVFANPPYIPLENKHLVQSSVLDYEPHSALFGGEDGLLYIGRFLKDARKHLKKGGKIYLEFDHLRKIETEELLKQLKYKNYKFHKDQFGKWRWVEVRD
jgi:release factor glutamine methyltransferase